MPSKSSSSPTRLRQTRLQFTQNNDALLSYELGQAVQALPPLYTRLLAGTISLLVFGTIAWAYWSQVDEVATAQGELIPSVQVRPIRAIAQGVILNIKVAEGDLVKKGQVLIERDPAIAQAEVDRLQKSVRLIREDIVRLEAEKSGRVSTGNLLQDALLASRLRDYDARRAGAIAEADRQAAAIREAQFRLARLQENLTGAQAILNLADDRERNLRMLVSPENRAISRSDYLAAQEKLVEARERVSSLKQEMAAQVQAIRQAEEAYQTAINSVNRVKTERESEILTKFKERQEELATVEGQLTQSRTQRAVETITAPVSGLVYQVKATQGPVQPGEDLLSILPEGEKLLLEVKVLNRDIGFIHPGMRAKVKLATFPYQEFGIVEGTVLKVSPNAIADKDLGPVFPTQIRLEQTAMQVRGQTVVFTPGMAATGEIVTRRKSILTFLLEPVTRRFSEAFSVR